MKKNKAPYDARGIANFILDYADGSETPVTVMKLLKLIFLAHAAYLEKTEKPLIGNTIRAWKYGPVIQSVYDNFKNHDDKPITSRATQLDVMNGTREIAKYELDEQSRETLIRVFNQFSRLTAFELSRLTHQEGWAWDKVWNSDEIVPGMVISNEQIRHHFPALNSKKLH